MKRRLEILLTIFALFIGLLNMASLTIPVAAATYVEGQITKDTIWTLVDSPFIVSKNIIVLSNATLTIEPGVEVRFGQNKSLTISGKLYANGTGKTITFTSNKDSPSPGDWGSVRFTGAQKSTLVDCLVTYAENGIIAQDGNVEIINSVIKLCSQNGVSGTGSQIMVQGSNVSLCSQNGIDVTDSVLTVKNVVVMQNTVDGISTTGTGPTLIQYCTVMANENGILVGGNVSSGVSILENKISANTLRGIWVASLAVSGLTISNNTVSANHNGIEISTMSSTSITNNSVSYNDFGFFYDAGTHTVRYNDIYQNTVGMDAASNSTIVVNAERNYWGDASGPYHISLNPAGQGNQVGGDGVNIDFIFFLTKSSKYIDLPPVASLIVDKATVLPNQDVMFIATNSHDEGSIDWYNFDFGDGTSSGWTTLSIFTHRYASVGNRTVRVTVMDDFGATSQNTSTVNVQSGLASLGVTVSLNIAGSVVSEGQHVAVSALVRDATGTLENANVQLYSVKGGGFAQSSGLTNASGYFVTTFSAQNITQPVNIRIMARASMMGHADGSGYMYVQVLPYLSVQVTASPSTVKSEAISRITVYVRSNGSPVNAADVTLSTNHGTLSSTAGLTDSSGAFSVTFTAPQTTTNFNTNITASASKADHVNGSGLATLAIAPKILTVEMTADTTVTLSNNKASITVYVGYESMSIEGANVTITADAGAFNLTTGLTDIDGNARFEFNAPPVSHQTDITITAHATSTGYAENQQQTTITVNPRTFNVRVEVTPQTIEAENQANITVYVTCVEDLTPVKDVLVSIAASDGGFAVEAKKTDAAGRCAFDYTAPQTTVYVSVNMTATVAKDGYVNSRNSTSLVVRPVTVAETGGGWPILTMLLIIIPIVIVVVVIVLVKLKVIAFSFGEEGAAE